MLNIISLALYDYYYKTLLRGMVFQRTPFGKLPMTLSFAHTPILATVTLHCNYFSFHVHIQVILAPRTPRIRKRWPFLETFCSHLLASCRNKETNQQYFCFEWRPLGLCSIQPAQLYTVIYYQTLSTGSWRTVFYFSFGCRRLLAQCQAYNRGCHSC